MIYFIIILLLFLLSFIKGQCWSIFWFISLFIIFVFPFGIFNNLLFYILCFIIFFIFYLFKHKKGCQFVTYFGIPGSGKTTYAAFIAKHSKKRVFSNMPISGTYKFDKSDIGVYDMSNSKILTDEAGTDYDNRNFKNNLTSSAVVQLKMHRHDKIDYYFFTQYWNDIDIKIRNLSTKLYYVKKSFIPFFIVRREIVKDIIINKVDHQILDGYKFKFFSGYYIFAPNLWKMFNTEDTIEREHKDFEKW